MSHTLRRTRVAVCASLLAFLAAAPVSTALAITQADIDASVEKGLEWLVAQDWSSNGCERVAFTGMVVVKLVDRAHDLGFDDPLDPDYEYSTQVEDGLDYIVNQAQQQTIGLQGPNDPDGNANGIGVYWGDNCSPSSHVMYNSGIATMALAAGGQNPGLLQDAVDFLAWAQADESCGIHRGGWRYNPNQCSSDNSNSGWVTLGLGYAQAAGITVPQFVKDDLSIWIDVIQDDVDNDAKDGGSWYDPSSSSVNTYKTGNLIYEMGLVGDTASTTRVQDAVDYIEREWNGSDTWCSSPTGQWLNNRQAMFAMMKGLDSLGIEMLDLNGDDVAETDWFWDEVAPHLLATQDPVGFWPQDCWANPVMSTAWALLTLERAVPVFQTCAILGDSSVFIGQRGVLGAGPDDDKPNVCSNGSLRLQARVAVNDEGFVKAFARDGELTRIGAQSILSDSVYTNADLTLLAHALVEGDAHAQGDMLLKAHATVVGDCQVGGSLGLAVGAGCGAETTSPESVAEFTLPECLVSAPGGDDIETIQEDAYVLDAGDYGDVDFAARNSVTLTGGDYTFKSLRFGPNSQVEIQAATKMQVENRLSINRGVEMTLNGPAAKDVKLFVNGAMTVDPQAKLGDHTVLYGTICGGPDSAIRIGQNSYLEGGLFGNEISVGAGVEFVAAPASLP